MKDRIYDSLKQSSQRWVSWTKQHAKELGDSALRHVERQDLLTERQRILLKIGEFAVQRLVVEQKKSISTATVEWQPLFSRLAEVEERLGVIDAASAEEPGPSETDHKPQDVL